MKTLFLFFLLWRAATCFSDAYPNPTSKGNQEKLLLQAQIKDILKKSPLKHKNLGLIISDFSRNIYFKLNEKRLFTPASLTKMMTASAMLHYFHPNLQFETKFLATAAIQESALKGSLYLQGGGDPSFVSESLWNLVNNLTRSGLKTVEGDLVLDDSLFKYPKKKKKFLFSDSAASYNAPISALSFNWNTVNVYVRPGQTWGSPAQVYIDPENSYIQLKNKALTQGQSRSIQVKRKPLPRKKQDQIHVQGLIPLEEPEAAFYKNISYPVLWTGNHALEFMKRRGIRVLGKLIQGTSPQEARPLASYKGRTLFRMVSDMMKFSNNFIADMLTVQLSLIHSPPPARMEIGLEKIRQYLKSQGILDFILENSSGLSRKNKFKPQDILKILIQDQQSLYSVEKMASYPLGGLEGTLKKRFQNMKTPSLIRAKTGWLRGVAGLAGTVQNQQGRQLFFVFIYNGKKNMEAQKLFDSLVHILTL